jgi:hypothetical protein
MALNADVGNESSFLFASHGIRCFSMSASLSFRVGEDAVTFPLAADVALLERLRASLPDEVAFVSDVGEPGVEEAVAGAVLAEAAEKLLRAIRKGVVGFPVVYCLKDPDGGTIHGGMQCNVNGRIHNFDIGSGRCSMQPTVPPYGAATDLRGEDEVVTDNGVFKIIRKVKPTELSKMLSGIRDFAKEHREAEILKMLC